LVYSNIGYNQNQLTVTFQSSNPSLVPVGNIKQIGSNLQVTPVGVQTGSADITVIVTNPNSQSTNTTFKLTVVPSTTPVFAQTQTIAINDNAAGTPYPSILTVSGVAGTVSKVTATLVGMSHSYPSDVSILLVGPQGQAVVLMSRAGGSVGINNTRLVFDDTSSVVLPQFTAIADGTYKPTDYKSSDTFFAGPPLPPYSHAMSAFTNTNPNGIWSLYVQDDQAGNNGSIAGGWILSITTSGPAISQVADTSTPENSSTNIPFTVSSSVVDVTNLTVTASSTNESVAGLIKSMTLSGTGASRSVLIVPGTNLPSIVTNVDATANVTLTVSDGTLSNSTAFLLTVKYVNQSPTITGLVDTNTPANVPVAQTFTVGDVDTAVSNLVINVSVATNALGTATVSGTDATRVLAYTPTGVQGTNIVTITLTDGTSTTTNSIAVISTPGLPPVVLPIVDQVAAGSRLAKTVKVNFSVKTGPVASKNLTADASADNTNLVAAITVAPAGNGTNFTASIVVNALKLGTANVTVFARDEYGIGTNSFKLTVNEPAVPTLAAIGPVGTLVNVSTNVTLNITSTDTPVANLLLSATDTNKALLKSVTFNAANTLATLPVVSNMVGYDLVTITGGDGFTNVSQTFSLTVAPVGAISMAPIGSQTTTANVAKSVALNITSPSTSVTNLTLTGTSTNKALVSGVTFSYNGRNMVATVNLVPNKGGTDYVTITATDGFSTALQSFVLTVTGGTGPTVPTLKLTTGTGGLTLSVHGDPGAVFTVQVSADLKTWSDQGTLTADANGNASTTVAVNPAIKTLFARVKQ